MSSPQEILDLARTQIGVHSPDNRTPYNIEYGMQGPGAAWCQMFVWWCLTHSGVDTIRTAWTPSGIAYYETLGRWVEGSNLDGAQPGDVIYYDFDNYAGQRTDHVGLIEAIDDTAVQTIEGNVGGGYVKRLWHRRGDSTIVGYGRPLYDSAVPAPAPVSPPAGDVFGLGSGGQKVRDIQTLMQAAGLYQSAPDGAYGPLTQAAVAEWQKRLGIASDGIWGPLTQRATDQFLAWLASNQSSTPAPDTVDLEAVAAAVRDAARNTLRRGSTGDPVRWLQLALNNNGAGLTVDGIFGPATEQAVRNYQQSRGLAVDGIAGPQTWGALTA